MIFFYHTVIVPYMRLANFMQFLLWMLLAVSQGPLLCWKCVLYQNHKVRAQNFTNYIIEKDLRRAFEKLEQNYYLLIFVLCPIEAYSVQKLPRTHNYGIPNGTPALHF